MISSVWRHEQDITKKGMLMLLPEHVRELLEVIVEEGFILTLVGGAVRDYFLCGHFSKDLDFELRSEYQYNEKDWAFHIGKLIEHLRENYGHLGLKIGLLSFSVMRIGWIDHEEEIELAPARIESYDNSEGLGHSDIDVTLVSNGDYTQTFARRDFTLNAMGIEFSKKEANLLLRFIDPFRGLQDLTAKELVPCGENFPKDPVRFCRALRFSLKYELKFSQLVCDSFKNFNLTQLSAFYFFREGFKVDFFKFVALFFHWSEKVNLPLSHDLCSLKFLAQIIPVNLGLSTVQEVLLFLIYHKRNKIESICIKDVENFAKVAKLKSSLIVGHTNLKVALEELEGHDPDEISLDIRRLSFGEFINYPHKNALKCFHKSMKRYCNLEEQILLLRQINPCLHKTILEYSKILPEALRGKAEFQQMINELGLAPELRNDALYYCHFKGLS